MTCYVSDTNKKNIENNIQEKTKIINEKIITMSIMSNMSNISNIFHIDNNIIHMFINKSSQSNGYINLIKEKDKYIGKKIRLYFHKLSKIEKICDIEIKNNDIITLLIDIILYTDFDYYTPMIDNIYSYINDNNIKEYVIYY